MTIIWDALAIIGGATVMSGFGLLLGWVLDRVAARPDCPCAAPQDGPIFIVSWEE